MSTSLYPLAPIDLLREKYVGKRLKDIETPAAVIDEAVVRRNCGVMLDAVGRLGFGWRAHVKTHKTTELTRHQIGPSTSNQAKIIVSTLIEAEQIVPLLQTYPNHNLLYGLPPGPSSVPRLSQLSAALGPSGLSLLIDHSDQISVIRAVYQASSLPSLVFIKIDMGGHQGRRAGIPPTSEKSTNLYKALIASQKEGICILHGLYSHAGHSYNSSSPSNSIDFLTQEISALYSASEEITKHAKSSSSNIKSLILSVGATPTTTAIRNLLLPNREDDDDDITDEEEDVIRATCMLRNELEMVKGRGHKIELHAGVYPLLDLQQLATAALPCEELSRDHVGLTILSEVLSPYPERNSVLVGSGSLVLGRDTCKAYEGFGILTPWNLSHTPPKTSSNVFSDSKYKISYISQEHGIISPFNAEDGVGEFEVGQKVRIWPNHACIASNNFGWYVVVDGEGEDRDLVVDVWVRFRGW